MFRPFLLLVCANELKTNVRMILQIRKPQNDIHILALLTWLDINNTIECSNAKCTHHVANELKRQKYFSLDK